MPLKLIAKKKAASARVSGTTAFVGRIPGQTRASATAVMMSTAPAHRATPFHGEIQAGAPVSASLRTVEMTKTPSTPTVSERFPVVSRLAILAGYPVERLPRTAADYDAKAKRSLMNASAERDRLRRSCKTQVGLAGVLKLPLGTARAWYVSELNKNLKSLGIEKYDKAATDIARRRKMIDKIIAQPIAGYFRFLEIARRLD